MLKKILTVCTISCFAISALALDCQTLPNAFEQNLTKMKNTDRLISKNYASRVSFMKEMYEELAINEGRSLYIPYGTYDSYYRSIRHEQDNLEFVTENYGVLESEFERILINLKKCLK